MIQAVISQMMVYWGHLYYLPDGVIKMINHIIAKFLWGDSQCSHKIHLCKLDTLTVPKKFGGWGLLDVHLFSHALLIKSLWRALTRSGFWPALINLKYLDGPPLMNIYRNSFVHHKRGLFNWQGFQKVMGLFLSDCLGILAMDNTLSWVVIRSRASTEDC